MGKIESYIKETGSSINDILKLTKEIDARGKGLSLRSIQYWEKGLHEPRRSKIQILVKALNMKLEQAGRMLRVSESDLYD